MSNINLLVYESLSHLSDAELKKRADKELEFNHHHMLHSAKFGAITGGLGSAVEKVGRNAKNIATYNHKQNNPSLTKKVWNKMTFQKPKKSSYVANMHKGVGKSTMKGAAVGGLVGAATPVLKQWFDRRQARKELEKRKKYGN